MACGLDAVLSAERDVVVPCELVGGGTRTLATDWTHSAWGQSARDFFAVLLANSCTNARETATESDFAKLMSVIAVSLHRSMGEKFEAAVFRTTATGTA